MPRLRATPAPVEWLVVPVLRYERLPFPEAVAERLSAGSYDWVIFASPRAVRFLAEGLVSHGALVPPETRVACVGGRTAEAAREAGFDPDFVPELAGTEGFLPGFSGLGPASALLPRSESGRETIAERLVELGWRVEALPIYRTLPVSRPEVAENELDRADWICFTSPSSAAAYRRFYSLPSGAKVACLGPYTENALRAAGIAEIRRVPDGKLERLGELIHA